MVIHQIDRDPEMRTGGRNMFKISQPHGGAPGVEPRTSLSHLKVPQNLAKKKRDTCVIGTWTETKLVLHLHNIQRPQIPRLPY